MEQDVGHLASSSSTSPWGGSGAALWYADEAPSLHQALLRIYSLPSLQIKRPATALQLFARGLQPRCSSSLQPVLSRNLSSRNCCTRRLLWCLCCLQQALKFFTFGNNQACGPPVFINTPSKACICIQRAHMVLRSCVLITQASQSCCVDAHISPIVSPYWQHFRCTAQRLLPQTLQRGKRIIL